MGGPDRSQIALIVRGYVKRNYDSKAHFVDSVILLLIEFYGSRFCFNERLLVQFALTMPNHSETSHRIAQFKKDDSPNSPIDLIVRGYVKRNYDSEAQFENKVILLIAEFYHSEFILIPRRCALLSSVIRAKMDSVPMSAAAIDLNDDLEEDKKFPWHLMQNVFRYLAHHNGKEPDPLPCPVRSIHMAQIVSDEWDATFIDDFEKKEVFEIILCANALKIQSLVHLGAAKIATLIKQLDQREINRIMEEEERYRREHATDDAVEADEDEEVKNDDEEVEEEVMTLNVNDENDEDEDGDEGVSADIDLAEPLSHEEEEVKIVNEAEEEVMDFEQAALNDGNDEDETASTEELLSNCSDLETSSDQNLKEMRELTPENQSGAVSGCEASAVNSEEEHVV